MPGTTQVPCHSGPGVRLHSWWMESFLTLILLILVLIPVLGLNLRLSVVLMDESIFSDFCPSDAQGDPTSNGSASSPSSPIRSTSKRIFSARAKKNFKSRRKFRVFYEKPRVEAVIDPFEELDHEENLWNVDTRPTYLQEAVDTDLFRDIRTKILPAKAEEIAKVFSTVIPGDQVDTELCSKSREKDF